MIGYQGQQYGLLVDEIGDVLDVPQDRVEANPPTLDRQWRHISTGVCQLDGNLLIVLDAGRLLDDDAEILQLNFRARRRSARR